MSTPIDSPHTAPDPSAEKDALIASLQARVASLEPQVEKFRNQLAEALRRVAALRDEVARLKGGPGRPNIKPNTSSGMERGTERKSPKRQKTAQG